MVNNENVIEPGDKIEVSFFYDGFMLVADAKLTENNYTLTKRFTSDDAELVKDILCSPEMEKGGVMADYFHKDRKLSIKREERKDINVNEITLDEDDLK